MKLYTESRERELAEQGVIDIHIRFRPRKLLSLSFVVLLHALFLFFLLKIGIDIKNGKAMHNPVVVFFDKLVQNKQGEPKAAEKQQPPTPKPSERSITISKPKVSEEAVQTPPPKPQEQAVPDMAQMIKAARERRQESETQAAAENQAAQHGDRGLSAQEKAEANVRHSMERASGQSGTSGVFQIVSKSVRIGSFTFRGWKVNTNSWKQTIEVDAGLGGDLDLAMVRKMIEIIRTHYKGDFRWESQRLGRVVNLSARVEDSAELEHFMLEEFPEFAKPKR